MPSAKSKRVNALLKREWENATTPEARERVLAMIERAKTDVNYWEQLGTAPIFPPMGLKPALGLAALSMAPVVGPVVAGGLGLYGAGQLAEGTSRYLGDVPGGGEQIVEGTFEMLPFAGALKKGAKSLLGDLMADVPVNRNTGRYYQPGGSPNWGKDTGRYHQPAHISGQELRRYYASPVAREASSPYV